MIALFRNGPIDGKWVEIKDNLNEVLVPAPRMEPPRIKSRFIQADEMDNFYPRSVAVYRQRSTEPEYRHVYEFMGMRYER